MEKVGVVLLKKPILLIKKKENQYVYYITEKKATSIITKDSEKYFDINYFNRRELLTNKRKRNGQIIFNIKPKNKRLRNKKKIYRFIEYEISLEEYNKINYGFDTLLYLKQENYSKIVKILILDEKKHTFQSVNK